VWHRPKPDQSDLEHGYPEIGMFGILPAYGLYAHHAEGLVLSNVRFDLAGDDLRPAIDCFDVAGLELSGFHAAGHPQASRAGRGLPRRIFPNLGG
jgi:hypothetical protein